MSSRLAHKFHVQIRGALLASLILAACKPDTPPQEVDLTSTTSSPMYLDSSQPIDSRVEDLLSRMTIEEKVGQMTQPSNKSLRPGDVTEYYIGSILSGGGGNPDENTVQGWADMVNGFQREALETRLAIPLVYGVDAVHGHGNLYGATIFPHQIGLGATRNPELVYRIGQAVALETRATGVHWDFAPVVAAPQDIRWGRTYEAYGEDTALVTELSTAFVRGLQTLPEDYSPAPGQTIHVLASPKHFIGDGGTAWGTSTTANYSLDQGDMLITEAEVREWFLPPYQAAIDAGAVNIMASYSSWQGQKLHGSTYWLTDVLKGELGFEGFIVSDWNAIDQVDDNYYTAVVTSINAGIDMGMIIDFKGFISAMMKGLENGDISEARVDDAVRRILKVKFQLGLFDHPVVDQVQVEIVGSDEHRELAREAVRESLVLLKNDENALPVSKDTPLIYVAGQGANDIGKQCGGWTINWQGGFGAIQPGTTILDGIQSAVSENSVVEYDARGDFTDIADVAIVVVGESPYTEGVGDREDLSLSQSDSALIETMRSHSRKLIVVILSGRPLVITPQYQIADAWVAAWLPGTEGQGVSDVLFGDHPFTGRLPFTWPRSNTQIPINIHNSKGKTGCDAPLFPFGYGLGDADSEPINWLDCE